MTAAGGGRIPLILDVDTGIDDALALLYACASPEADLIAVTCLPGNAGPADVARNTRAVLELAGRADVEVALGREAPLVRPLEITPDTHGPTGIGYATLPEPSAPLSARFAPEVLVEEARRRPGEITLITLGPLTTLATAVQIEPDLPRILRRWVVMGGAYRVPGNTTPVSEWNVHCDPEAAAIAFGAWRASIERAPTTTRALAIGLDVTESVRLLPEHVAALVRAAPGSPVTRFIEDALRFYMEFHARYDGFYGAFVHDPLVTAAALDESLVRTAAVAVDVDTAGGIADGQTVADWRGLLGRAPNADVAERVDGAAFLDRWVERVGRLAAARSDVSP